MTLLDKARTAALVATMLATTVTSAAGPAGVAAFACRDGAALHLLAFDPVPGREGWAHLGGRAEAGESTAQTAVREFREESNCAFGDAIPEVSTLAGPSVAGGFSTYVARVPFIAAATIAQARDCAHVERAHWVWVAHDKLMAALRSPDGSPVVEVAEGRQPAVHLWPVSARALRKAVDDQVLPTGDPCAK